MSPFTIPNAPDTPYADLAEPDSGDYAIIAAAHNGFYVQSGCAATVTGTDLNVTIAAGIAVVNGAKVTVTGNAVVLPTAAGATNPRIDLIVVDGTGVAQRRPSSGTANANVNPVFPAFGVGTEVVLCAVYMPAGVATVGVNQLTDKRVLAQPHSGIAHTGDVLPDGADQAMGAGSLNLARRLSSGVSAPAANTRTVYHENYTSQAGTGLTATAQPRIVVKDPTNVVIPMEAPLYGQCDWLIIYDGTNYRARNMKTATIDYVSPTSLHAVHNPAAMQGGVADGLSSGSADLNIGSSIVLATPPGNHEMYTDASLQMQMGETLVGPGRGMTIRPSTAFPNGGGPTAANAIIDAYSDATTVPARLVGRVNITGLTIRGTTASGATRGNLIGILQRRPTNNMSPAAGGDSSKSEIWNNEVSYFDGAGIQLGLASNPSEATANIWGHDNFIHDGTANSRGLAIYIGDSEWGAGMQVTTATGYCVYIKAAITTLQGASHYGLQGQSNTHGNIYIESGAGNRIIGAYLDNINSPGIQGIYTAGGKTQVRSCWFNAGGIESQNTIYAVVIDGADDCVVENCEGEGNNSNGTASSTLVYNYRAIAKTVANPNGLRVTNNTFRFAQNVWDGTNAPAINNSNEVFYSSDFIQANYTRRYSDARGSTGAIATGATVAHSLDRAPTAVLLTPKSATPTAWRVSAVSATTFTVAYTGGGTNDFYWEAYT